MVAHSFQLWLRSPTHLESYFAHGLGKPLNADVERTSSSPILLQQAAQTAIGQIFILKMSVVIVDSNLRSP